MLCAILIQFIESRPTKTAFSKIPKDIIFILRKVFFLFLSPYIHFNSEKTKACNSLYEIFGVFRISSPILIFDRKYYRRGR